MPTKPPPPPDVFKTLTQLPPHELIQLGLQNFDGTLYLFHATWFDAIPEGMWVTTVNGEQVEFSKQMSRDQRYGWLGYGVKANV